MVLSWGSNIYSDDTEVRSVSSGRERRAAAEPATHIGNFTSMENIKKSPLYFWPVGAAPPVGLLLICFLKFVFCCNIEISGGFHRRTPVNQRERPGSNSEEIRSAHASKLIHGSKHIPIFMTSLSVELNNQKW